VPARAEEGDQVVGGIPDQPPGDNAVNAAEQRITDFQAASEAIRYGVDVDSAVDAPTLFGGSFYFELAQVGLEIALTGEVADFDEVVIDQLEPGVTVAWQAAIRSEGTISRCRL